MGEAEQDERRRHSNQYFSRQALQEFLANMFFYAQNTNISRVYDLAANTPQAKLHQLIDR